MVRAPEFDIEGPFVIAQSITPNFEPESDVQQHSFVMGFYPDDDVLNRADLATLYVTGDMTIQSSNWIAGCLVQLNIQIHDTKPAQQELDNWVNEVGETLYRWLAPLLIHRASSSLGALLGQMPMTDIDVPTEWDPQRITYSSELDSGRNAE